MSEQELVNEGMDDYRNGAAQVAEWESWLLPECSCCDDWADYLGV